MSDLADEIQVAETRPRAADAIDRAILRGLVSRRSIGVHGITPAELAAPHASPARPESVVRERLEALERAGFVWQDARGYRCE